MSNNIKFAFTVAASDTFIVTSNQTTDKLDGTDNMRMDRPFSIQFTPTVAIVGGPPTMTLEVSNDGVNWAEFDALTTGIQISKIMKFQYFPFKNMRVIITANGATAGTGSLGLYFKG